MQLIYNYHGNIMLTLLFINPSKFDTWHYGDVWGIFFLENLISTIYYDCSFYMVLDCDKWHSQNFPLGILIEFWKNYFKNIFT
jgi:hypothetical protein